MQKTTLIGVCSFCGKTFAKNVMRQHLDSCKQRKATAETELGTRAKDAKYFHIVVVARSLPEYWIHLEVRADAQLKKLDDFLRRIWLEEVCGHLSAFTIETERYVNEVIESPLYYFFKPEKGMEVKFSDVLKPGMRFTYYYDFGTTTELDLRVASERMDKRRREKVRLMARNTPPLITCGVCGNPATQVCRDCIWKSKGWLCDKCARKHECEEEALLPVVNSPRVGICGYTGEAELESTTI